MRYEISGIDEKQDDTLWVIEARNETTAAHIAELFRKEGYRKVTIKNLPDALAENSS